MDLSLTRRIITDLLLTGQVITKNNKIVVKLICQLITDLVTSMET